MHCYNKLRENSASPALCGKFFQTDPLLKTGQSISLDLNTSEINRLDQIP